MKTREEKDVNVARELNQKTIDRINKAANELVEETYAEMFPFDDRPKIEIKLLIEDGKTTIEFVDGSAFCFPAVFVFSLEWLQEVAQMSLAGLAEEVFAGAQEAQWLVKATLASKFICLAISFELYESEEEI